MTNAQRLALTASEPIFWSRLNFSYDPPRYDGEGRVEVYDSDQSVALREHKLFADAGVKLHTTILNSGWLGVDRYDYSLCDDTLSKLFAACPDVYYMPRIKLNPPVEWCVENPEEAFVAFNGPREKEEIRALIRRLAPYFGTNGLPNSVALREGSAGLQSFSSEKWIKDAGEALIRLIRHIEGSEWGERVAAYQICFGGCGESVVLGAWNGVPELCGDFGIGHRRAFCRRSIARYGSLAALREAWGDESLTEETISVPTPFELERGAKDVSDFFRAGAGGRKCVDYSEFVSETVSEAILRFARLVKRETRGKPVGAFYGYLHINHQAEAGHLAIDRLLDSPDIDFFASPKMYYRCEAGQPGGEQSPSLSIRRRKLWIDELDNHTHISFNYMNKNWITANMEETQTVLWREVTKNLSYNDQNFWWMDLKGGWFDDPEIMDEIGRLVRFTRETRAKPHESVAEIMYVLDERSFTVTDSSYGFTGGHRDGVIVKTDTELKLCGAPVDPYRLRDLLDMELGRYKLFVFANAFLFCEGEWERMMSRLPEDSVKLFIYAAGACRPEFSLDNVKRSTGIAVRPCGDGRETNGYGIDVALPPLEIVPEDGVVPLAFYPDGKIKAARRGNTVLCANPYMLAADFRALAESAGCKMYAPCGCAVYADSRFTAVFPPDKTFSLTVK